jgi:hypothetical protein
MPKHYQDDPIFGSIDQDTGIPDEYVSCPGCGHKYGYRGRRACTNCDECEPCHKRREQQQANPCTAPNYISGAEMKERAAEQA